MLLIRRAGIVTNGGAECRSPSIAWVSGTAAGSAPPKIAIARFTGPWFSYLLAGIVAGMAARDAGGRGRHGQRRCAALSGTGTEARSAATSRHAQEVVVRTSAPTRATKRRCAGVDADEETLEDGEVLVHVAKVCLTANSITYAVAGALPPLLYFKHFTDIDPSTGEFPADARPVAWGAGVVVASRKTGVPVGLRIYGMFPLSPSVTLRPVDMAATQFLDGAAQRQDLIPSYRTYRTAQDPFHNNASGTADEEDFNIAVRGLFVTGFAMAQHVLLEQGRDCALLVSSASSRTAYSAAFEAKRSAPEMQVIGVTSEANVEFTRALGLYDVVCRYRDVGSLPRQPVAFLDVAGSPKITQDVYNRFGEEVVYAAGVGLAHCGSRDLSTEPDMASLVDSCGGAKMAPLLVYPVFEKLNAVHGQKQVLHMLGEALAAFKAKFLPALRIVRHYGADEALEVFEGMASRGGNRPDQLDVVSLWPRDLAEPVAGGRGIGLAEESLDGA